jgi:hypothetical protein
VAVSSLLPLLHTMRYLGLAILLAHAVLTMTLLSVSARTRYATFAFLFLVEFVVFAVERRVPHLLFAPLALRSVACACANAAALLQLWRLLRQNSSA